MLVSFYSPDSEFTNLLYKLSCLGVILTKICFSRLIFDFGLLFLGFVLMLAFFVFFWNFFYSVKFEWDGMVALHLLRSLLWWRFIITHYKFGFFLSNLHNQLDVFYGHFCSYFVSGFMETFAEYTCLIKNFTLPVVGLFRRSSQKLYTCLTAAIFSKEFVTKFLDLISFYNYCFYFKF